MSVLYGLPLDSESLNIQRKAALYGTTDPKTDPEAGIFETLCNHLVNVLPELFQGNLLIHASQPQNNILMT